MNNKLKGVSLTLLALGGAAMLAGCSGVSADQTLNGTTVTDTTQINQALALTKDYVVATRGAVSSYTSPVEDVFTGVPAVDIFDGNATTSSFAGGPVAFAVDQSVDDTGGANPSGNFISNVTADSTLLTNGGFQPGVSWLAISNTSSSVNSQFCYVVSRTDIFPAFVNAPYSPPAYTQDPSLMIFAVTSESGGETSLANGSAIDITATTYVNATINGTATIVNVTGGNATVNTAGNVAALAGLVPYNLVTNITGNTTAPDGTPVNFTGQAFSSSSQAFPSGGTTSSGGIASTISFNSTISQTNPVAEGLVLPDSTVDTRTGLLTTPYTTYGVVETGYPFTYTAVNQTLVNATTPIETFNFEGGSGLSTLSIQSNGGNFTAPPYPLAFGSFYTYGSTDVDPYAVYVSPDGTHAYMTLNYSLAGTDQGGTQGEDLNTLAEFVPYFGASTGTLNVTVSAGPSKESYRRGYIYTFALDTTTGAFILESATPSPTNTSDLRECVFGPNGKLYATCYEANTVSYNGSVIGSSNGTVAEYNIDPANGTLTLANSFTTGPGSEGLAISGSQLFVVDHLTNAGNVAIALSGGLTPLAARSGVPFTVFPGSGLLAQAPVGSIEVFPINSDGSLAPRSQIIQGSTDPTIASGDLTSLGNVSAFTGMSWPEDVAVSPVFAECYAVQRELPDPHVRSVVATDAVGNPFRVIIAGQEDAISNGTSIGELQTFSTANGTVVPGALSSALSISPFIGGQRNPEHLTVDPDGRFIYTNFRSDPPVFSTVQASTATAGQFNGAITYYSAGAPGHFAPGAGNDGQARLLNAQILPGGVIDPVQAVFYEQLRQ